MKGRGPLVTFFGIFGCICGAIYVRIVEHFQLHQVLGLLPIYCLWMGMLLAISFFEAWMKFRAPFLPRYLALDVGRTIFPCLNAIECSFAITLWLLLDRNMQESTADDPLLEIKSIRSCLLILTSIVVFQVTYLTPQLVLRGKHLIHQQLRGSKDYLAKLDEIQQKHWIQLQKEVQENPTSPSTLTHLAYIVLEVTKLLLLEYAGVLLLGYLNTKLT